MKKILLGILAFAAVACNNDVVISEQTSSAITFGDSFVEVKTRATEDPSTTTETINAFDVWAFINNDPTGTVFNQERVKRVNGVWQYTNTQWWAQSKSYDFFAVSPVDDANIVVDNSTMNEYGLGNIAFTNVDGTTDLLYSALELETGEEFPYYDDAVRLQFMHLLSKIKFTFKNGFTSENQTLKVTNIMIEDAPAEGNIDVNKQQRTDYAWVLTQGKNTELSFGYANDDVAIACGQSGSSQYERLTIPADANRTYKISFDLELFNGTQSGMTSHKEVTLTNQAFEIGKNYNLVATIDASNFYEEALNPIVFDDIEVLPWDPADAEALATPKVTATVKENNVTLAWEAIANAEKYSVTIGNQAPEYVEDTTYTFTGDYETEYTFAVVAIPAENSEYTNSAVAVVTVTTEAKASAVASEWGIAGDLNNWGGTSDVKMYNTDTENLFVAKNVEIKSGAIKVRANNTWNDAKNYGFEVAGKAYADKYYAVITGSGSQNITPMEYGTYDVYFDLANKRVALMTPGKAYAEAEDGGKPLVVVEGLKEHEWGVVGSFNNWDVANYVTTVVDGDWAVAKNVALTKNAEFKFAADKAWTLSYGSACDVVADKTYDTYNNGGNMKFVGEDGNYDIYFSLVSAEFYMTAAAAAPAPVALATPVVTATVSENTVALTWEAVENADKYSVTVGTEMPVFVEETTYIFTGDYATEYTFSVVAVPADETAYTASEAAVVTATTEAAPVVEPEVLTELDADAYYIYKQATEMKGGKWYAIVYENKAATGVTGNYGYLKVTEAASRANGISLPATCAFGFLTTDDGYTIQQFDGKYVYQTGTFDSFNVNATLPADGGVWSVAVNGNEYTITNNTMSKFVQYDSAYNSYGCYATAKGSLPTLYELVEVDNTPAILGVSPSSLSFAADGESKTITVSTYGIATLNVNESADWVSTSKAENIVTVTVDANTGEARETTLTISYGDDSQVVTIAQVAPSTGESYKVIYDFTQIDGFSSWTSSYSEHTVEYNEATVCFEKANRQSGTITNMPVTKGNSVTLVAKNNATITAAAFECQQWGTKTQTITLYYSTDGGNTYTSTNVKSTNFSIESSTLPEGTNAVKIGFSSTSNQVGIKSATITYK